MYENEDFDSSFFKQCFEAGCLALVTSNVDKCAEQVQWWHTGVDLATQLQSDLLMQVSPNNTIGHYIHPHETATNAEIQKAAGSIYVSSAIGAL